MRGNSLPKPKRSAQPIQMDAMISQLKSSLQKNQPSSQQSTRSRWQTKEEFHPAKEKPPQSIKPAIRRKSIPTSIVKSNDIANETDFQELPKSNIEKRSCWQCYQLKEFKEDRIFMGKFLCSMTCLNLHKASIMVQCGKCSSSILKEQAIRKYLQWYCNESCIPSEEEFMLAEMRKLALAKKAL